MKNLRINKKRLSAAMISLVMGASSLIGLSGCGKEKAYDPEVDYTSTEITKVFADDTKLDEAIDSEVAVYDDMSITEALDELETSLYVVNAIENNFENLPTIVSELEKLSDEDYKRAENLTKEEFDVEFQKCRGFTDEKTNNVFKSQEVKIKGMKMAAHKYECSKKYVQKNADKIIEKYLLYSVKSVIANETNIDGDSINKIVIPYSTVNGKDGNTDISIDVNGTDYILDVNTAGIGEGVNALYNFQSEDKKELTSNDYLKYIDIAKKITMLGAKVEKKALSEKMEITNDVKYKDANKKIERILKK